MRSLVHLFTVLVLAIAGPLLLASPAMASCAERTVPERVADADVVAYGSLVSIRMTFAPASPVVTFRPERVLEGVLSGDVEVFFGPTHGGPITSVDYPGAPPQKHTLYLRGADGGYETDLCSGSHEGAPTSEEDKILGRGVVVASATDEATRALVPVLVVSLFAVAGIAIAIALRVRRRAV